MNDFGRVSWPHRSLPPVGLRRVPSTVQPGARRASRGQGSELWCRQDGSVNRLMDDAAASMQPVEPAQRARAHGRDLRLLQRAVVAQHLMQARAA